MNIMEMPVVQENLELVEPRNFFRLKKAFIKSMKIPSNPFSNTRQKMHSGDTINHIKSQITLIAIR